MLKILSIDFDYFIDVTTEERDRLFPQGAAEIPKKELKKIWDKLIEGNPEIEEIGVIEEIQTLNRYLTENIKQATIRVAKSHKDISKIIENIPRKVNIDIVNIDYHHDYFHYFTDGDEYNCGNWLRRLKEDRPNTKIRWVRREDSEMNSLEGRFPYESMTDINKILHEEYDVIFLCFSPEWTPPHLEKEFRKIIESFRGGMQEIKRIVTILIAFVR